MIPFLIIAGLLAVLLTVARKERAKAKKAREAALKNLNEKREEAEKKKREKNDLFQVLLKDGSFEHIPPKENE
ncbi:MAG: hypothetical protein AAB842_00680 [Patescibacteria group bacterium]